MLNRDLELAKIPKRDSDRTIVHVHALRHSFGTQLSKAGVAPRTAQGLMRHSNISLTMNTYTDARLLETSAAIDQVQLLKFEPRTVAPTVAPTAAQSGQNQSQTDNLGEIESELEETKKP